MSTYRKHPGPHRRATILLALLLASMSCQLLPAASTPSPPDLQPTDAPLQTVSPLLTQAAVQTQPPVETQSTIPTLPPAETQLPIQTLPPVVTQPTNSTEAEGAFTLTRLTAIVKAGTTPPLPKVNDNQPVPFPNGSIVTVSEDGEAILQGNLEGNQCKIFVFFDTRLQKKSCPESTFTGSNVSCVQDGSAVFDKCSNMLVQTPTAEFQLTGTWIEVTYRRDLQTSVLLVSEGLVEAYPVTDASSYSRGDSVMVGAGQFLYTAPDDMLSQVEVPGAELRQANDWDDMEALIQTYNLQRWYERAGQHAAESSVPFPNISPRAGAPDLVIRLEARDYGDNDTAQAYANPDIIGVPVRATVINQGDGPAGLFKVSVNGTASDGTYVRAFTVPGETDVFYPHTAQPLQPGESIVFEGLVFFPSSMDAEQVSMTALADSCSGEEFTPDECFVAESDEGNNLSEPVFGIVGIQGR